MSQDKAQLAVNGHSLNKGCNAVLAHLWTSLWARRAAAIRGVASLVKGTPFPARRVLLLTAARLADTHTLFVTPHWTFPIEFGALEHG
jgi:hypothetical protein